MAIRTARFSAISLQTLPTVPSAFPITTVRYTEGRACKGNVRISGGMVTNIDDNMARLRHHLRILGIEENTILIFMTDNGSAMGCDLDVQQFVTAGYNAGMRGRKGSPYEGGHRVPLFMHWPDGGFTEKHEVHELTANIDLLPTLIDLCDLEVSSSANFHGTSIVPLLKNETEAWEERVIVTDSQRVENPIKWKGQCNNVATVATHQRH